MLGILIWGWGGNNSLLVTASSDHLRNKCAVCLCVCGCVHRYFLKRTNSLCCGLLNTCKQRFRSLKTELLENSCQVEDSHKHCLRCLCVDRKTGVFFGLSPVFGKLLIGQRGLTVEVYMPPVALVCAWQPAVAISYCWCGWDFFLNWRRTFFKKKKQKNGFLTVPVYVWTMP